MRLMGTNIHPSRKTEIDKKEEKEELITIKSTHSSSHSVNSHNSNDGYNSHHYNDNHNDADTDICTNNEIIGHHLLHRLTDSERENKEGKVNEEYDRNGDSNSDVNNVSKATVSVSGFTNVNNSNVDNRNVILNNSYNSSNSNNDDCSNNDNNNNNNNNLTLKCNPLSSISSNLNLLEGDLPPEMLDDFHIPSGPITPVIVGVIFNVLKQGGRLSFKSVHKILRISFKFLSDLPNTTHCCVEESDRLTTVGDIHG